MAIIIGKDQCMKSNLTLAVISHILFAIIVQFSLGAGDGLTHAAMVLGCAFSTVGSVVKIIVLIILCLQLVSLFLRLPGHEEFFHRYTSNRKLSVTL